MDIILKKILLSLVLILTVYIWNKFVPKWLVNSMSNFHKKNNSENIDRFPITLLIGNEMILIRFMQGFYWVGLVMMIIGVWIGE